MNFLNFEEGFRKKIYGIFGDNKTSVSIFEGALLLFII